MTICKNFHRDGADSVFDMCDKGNDYKVYQYIDQVNNEYIQIYMSTKNPPEILNISATTFDLWESGRSNTDIIELSEEVLSNRKWIPLVEFLPDDSKYHKALEVAHEYFYGKRFGEMIVDRNTVEPEDYSDKIWQPIKRYKIPGRKGYVSEEEFREWTNSIPDEYRIPGKGVVSKAEWDKYYWTDINDDN